MPDPAAGRDVEELLESLVLPPDAAADGSDDSDAETSNAPLETYERADQEELTDKSVLVVDDNATNRQFLE